MHGDSLQGLPKNPSNDEPAGSLADDELAAELPGFALEETIGRGGMGVVWRARERVLDRHVAIKLLRNENSEAAFVERFTREARVLAHLHHPNIITMFSFGRTRSNHCYLVMEMVEGTDLAKMLAKGPLEVPLALRIIDDVCAALQHAHDLGFVHRDVKPGNVLLDTTGKVKVADLLSKRRSRSIARPRQMAMAMAKELTNHSLPEIGDHFGGRDHTTVIHACRKVKSLVLEASDFAEDYKNLMRILSS